MTPKYENVLKTIFMLELCRMNQQLIIPDVLPIKKNSEDTGFKSCSLQYFCYNYANKKVSFECR